MRLIDTGALEFVARALGIGNPATATEPVNFDDELLQQVLDVGNLISRAGTIFPSEGIWGASIDNTHAGAGLVSTTVDPFNLGGTAVAPFPEEVPEHLDVYLLSVSPVTLSGAGNFNGGDLSILTPATAEAFGGVGSHAHRIMALSSEVSLGLVGSVLSETADGSGARMAPPSFRLPRGATIRFRTDASLAASYRADLLLGLFPRGLGQDGSF